jgi:hypothetical protein
MGSEIAVETVRTQVAYGGIMIIGLLLGAAALGGGFVPTRNFVRRKLRYVDAAQKTSTPLVAGVVATMAALPIAALPVITVPMAVLFGLGVGTGWASGQKPDSSP